MSRPETGENTEEIIQAIRRIMTHEPSDSDEGEVEAAKEAPADAATNRIEAAFRRVIGDKKSPPTVLEALILEVLEPYIKDWVDKRLPELVERVVREETQKLTIKTRNE